MKEQKGPAHAVVLEYLVAFFAPGVCGRTRNGNEMHLLAPQLRPHVPALDVGEVSFRNAEFHRADRPAERTRKNQEYCKNAADDQAVGALQAIVRERISEHQKK